jgi:uncharacterized protein (TIGR03067 family)
VVARSAVAAERRHCQRPRNITPSADCPKGARTTPSFTVNALAHSLVLTSWWLAAAAASAQEPPANKPAKEKLQGRWLTVEGEEAGKPVDKSVIGKQAYEFKGDVLIVEINSVVFGAAKFTIHDNTKPFEMDIIVGSLGTNPAIFRFDGDRLRICMDKPGGKRPTEFRTAPGTMQKMFVFERAAVAAPTQPPPAWEQLLWWLPEDTETVVVATGLEIPRRNKGPKRTGESLRWLPAGPLLTVHDGFVGDRLVGQKTACAIEGSRRFKGPREVGESGHYEGCHILQFEPGAEDYVEQVFRSCMNLADQKFELVGPQVAQFNDKRDQPLIRTQWTYFIARPHPGTLICATDRAFLEDTLKRAGTKASRRALAADLPEWKQVDVSAGVWAVRHYRKETAATDGTSPLRPGKSPAEIPHDPAAIGFVFWYPSGPNGVARARYLSASPNAFGLARRGWLHDALPMLKPIIDQTVPGVVEITTPLTKDNEVGFLLVLLSYLGHAVAL